MDLFFIAIIFKIQHWPGASFSLLISILLFSLIALIGTIKMRRGNNAPYYKATVPRATLYLIIAVGLFLSYGYVI